MNNLSNRRVFLQVLCLCVTAFVCVFVLMGSSITYPNISVKYQQILGLPQVRKGYLSSNYGSGMNGGLGNNLFELLTVIGIADQLKRLPYIRSNDPAMLLKMGYRIRMLFPQLEQQFRFVYWNITELTISFNAGRCCVFDSPERLRNISDEYIQIQGAYFQSFKYFDHLRNDVRRWLLPNETIQKLAEAHIDESKRNNFFVCVHIRRGDFATDGMHEPSDGNFSTIALRYLINKYKRPMREVGVIVMGNGIGWEKEVFKDFPEALIMETTPEEDLSLTRKYCEAVLITAPSSTFGFFLGYLSKNFDVYYRDILTTRDKVQNEMKPEDFFPPSWTKLWEINGRIREVK